MSADLDNACAWSRHRFASTVYRCISLSGVAIIKGGAVRNRVEHHFIMKKYLDDTKARVASMNDAALPFPSTPTDINCKLLPLKPIEPEMMTHDLWLQQYNQLINHLRDFFGSHHVVTSLPSAKNPRVAWITYRIAIHQSGGINVIHVNVTVPSPSTNIDAIKEEDGLYVDVDGLYGYGQQNKLSLFQDVYDTDFNNHFILHPMLEKRDYTVDMVIEAILHRHFTIVLSERVKLNEGICLRILHRLRSGWTGTFSTFDCPKPASWRYDEIKGRVVRDGVVDVSLLYELPGTDVEFCVAVLNGIKSNETEQKDQQSEKQSETTTATCCICLDNTASYIVIGCWHLCMCKECSDAILENPDPKERRCPICRTEDIRVQQVFTP